MAIYEQLNSIYEKDGKKYSVDLNTWGKLALTGSELSQFLADMEAVSQDYKPYLDAGNIVVTTMTESVTSAQSIAVTINTGTRIERSPDLPADSRLEYWTQQMQADPQTVTYNPEIRIS